jgi:hypothetical protein
VTRIDYILQNQKDVITRYITFQREAENCSTHDPVHAIVPVFLDFKTEEDDVYTIPHRINWDRVDISRYEDTVNIGYTRHRTKTNKQKDNISRFGIMDISLNNESNLHTVHHIDIWGHL